MSLANVIAQARAAVQILDDYGLATQIDISEEVRLSSQAVLNVAVQLVDATDLYIRLFLATQKGTIQLLSYAYQYQHADGSLIFRYDNAKHRPELGFDGHKHRADGTIIPAEPPTLQALVEEVVDYVTR